MTASIPSGLPRFVGRAFLRWVQATGGLAVLLARTLLRLPVLDRRELLRSLTLFGYRSLPLAAIVATLIGATVVLQTGLYVQRFGARSFLGWAAGYAMLWEFGPLLLGLVMAARVGARNAAELASLGTGGQLEALRGISVDAFALLVAPRIVAITLSLALLSAAVFALAIGWEAAAAWFTLQLPTRFFLQSFSELLGAADLAGGVLKSVCFGVAIALVSTRVGLATHGGARAVGQAAASSVVWSCAAIFSLDFALTPVLAMVLR